jgi:hypothetical protein
MGYLYKSQCLLLVVEHGSAPEARNGNPLTEESSHTTVQPDSQSPLHLSAKAARKDCHPLTEAEIEAAEEEALAWARRANSCCG